MTGMRRVALFVLASMMFAPVAATPRKASPKATPKLAATEDKLIQSCDAHKFETVVDLLVDGQPKKSKVKLCGVEGQSNADWIGTLKDAIGAEIADYLVKPVNPRQILSVVTRLLDGDRIRQQRLSRDFATRFRDLESRRGSPMAWREWMELAAELATWEVRLGEADEPGLSEALRTLQISMRQDFARFIEQHYPRWLKEGGGDRPPLSVDIGAEFLDMLRTSVNVLGNCLATVVIARWEGEFPSRDAEQPAQAAGSSRALAVENSRRS